MRKCSTLLLIGLLCLIGPFLPSSCVTTSYSASERPHPLARKIVYDLVTNTYKITWEMTHLWTKESKDELVLKLLRPNLESQNGFISQYSSFTKEAHVNGQVVYTLHARITMGSGGFPLSDSLFLVGDKRFVAAPLTREKSAMERQYQVRKERKFSSDSNVVEVLTRITENNSQLDLLYCAMNGEDVEQLVGSTELNMRYYQGGRPLTLAITGRHFETFTSVMELDLKETYEKYQRWKNR